MSNRVAKILNLFFLFLQIGFGMLYLFSAWHKYPASAWWTILIALPIPVVYGFFAWNGYREICAREKQSCCGRNSNHEVRCCIRD